MGLGSEKPQRTIYYLGLRSQDKDKKIDPHFTVQKRDASGMHTLPVERSVSGKLISIGTGSYELKKDSGDMIPTIKLFLVDGDNLYKIEANAKNNLVRGLMNTVIGTRDFDEMEIRLYVKNEFANIFITNNGEKTIWKFDYEKEIKPLIKEVDDPQKPGKKVKVMHAVDDLLMKHWKELIPYVEERAKKLGYTASVASAPATATGTEGSLQDDFDKITPDDLEPGGVHNPAPVDTSDDLPF